MPSPTQQALSKLLRYVTPLLCLAGLSPLAQAQDSVPASQQAVIEIVRLQYRDPALVRAAIEPHLDERGAISQIDHNLIISTSRANLNELQALIGEVDVPLKRFLIRVDFDYAAPPGQTLPDGAQLTVISTQDLAVDNPVQSIVVTEGEYAYFSRSESTPRLNPVFAPWGMQLEQDAAQSRQSVAVRAQMAGPERVSVELALASTDTLPGDETRTQLLQSTSDLSLNQWLPLNSARFRYPQAENGLQFFSTQYEGGLAVRVEVMPD